LLIIMVLLTCILSMHSKECTSSNFAIENIISQLYFEVECATF